MSDEEEGPRRDTRGNPSESKQEKKKGYLSGLILLQEEILEFLIDSIAEVSEKLNSADRDNLKSWFKAKKKGIESEMEVALKNHKSILSSNMLEEDNVRNYISDKVFSQIRDASCNFHALIDDEFDQDISRDRQNNDGSSEISDLKLPRLDLTKFSGKYDEWLPFNNLFTASVHENSKLNPVQKLHFLMKSVTDDAYNQIKNLSLTADNYEKARNLLDNQYNHKRKVAHTYMRKLLDGKQIVNENVKDLKHFVSNTKDCLISLETLGLPVKEWGYILLYVLQSKIPNITNTKWEEELGSSREIPSFEKFIDFVESRYRTLEMLEIPEKDNKKINKALLTNANSSKKFKFNNSDQSKPKQYPKKNESYTNTSGNTSNISKSNNVICNLCRGNHIIGKCKRFLNNTPAQRKHLAEEYNLCQNCLGSNHDIDHCYSLKLCIYCKQRHHSLLHIHTNPTVASHFTTVSEALPNTITNVQPNSSNAFYASTNMCGVRVLGTAMVRIVNASGFAVTARVLLYSGAEENYITNGMVNCAGLRKYRAPSSITGLNDTTLGAVDHKVQFKIVSLDGNFEYFTEASVVETITSKMPSQYIEPECFGFLNNLPLADPNFNHPPKINLLLGIGFELSSNFLLERKTLL